MVVKSPRLAFPLHGDQKKTDRFVFDFCGKLLSLLSRQSNLMLFLSHMDHFSALSLDPIHDKELPSRGKIQESLDQGTLIGGYTKLFLVQGDVNASS
jgi:hypothetical protein